MAENLTKVLYDRAHKTIDFMKGFIIYLHVKKKTGSEKKKVREENNKFLSLPKSQIKMCIFAQAYMANLQEVRYLLQVRII